MKIEKLNVTIFMEQALIDKIRDIVYWTPGGKISDVMSDACWEHIKRIERKRGEPFPKRKAEVKRGRRHQAAK